MFSDATVPISTGPILRAEIRDLECRFGVVAWFGFHTRRWWALAEGRLVEAATPAGLADAVIAIRGVEVFPSQNDRPDGEPGRQRQVSPAHHHRARRRVRPSSRPGRGHVGLDAPEAITDTEGGVH